jgi:hypothetical protein
MEHISHSTRTGTFSVRRASWQAVQWSPDLMPLWAVEPRLSVGQQGRRLLRSSRDSATSDSGFGPAKREYRRIRSFLKDGIAHDTELRNKKMAPGHFHNINGPRYSLLTGLKTLVRITFETSEVASMITFAGEGGPRKKKKKKKLRSDTYHRQESTSHPGSAEILHPNAVPRHPRIMLASRSGGSPGLPAPPCISGTTRVRENRKEVPGTWKGSYGRRGRYQMGKKIKNPAGTLTSAGGAGRWREWPSSASPRAATSSASGHKRLRNLDRLHVVTPMTIPAQFWTKVGQVKNRNIQEYSSVAGWTVSPSIGSSGGHLDLGGRATLRQIDVHTYRLFSLPSRAPTTTTT